jgi:hypothetical protein
MKLMTPSSLVVTNKTAEPIPYLLLAFQVSKGTSPLIQPSWISE